MKDVKNEKIKKKAGRASADGSQNGFTIMELAVALGVFSIIATIVSSIFLGTLRSARFVGAQAAAVDNVGLIVEQIAREVRTGASFTVPQGTSSSLHFINYNSQDTTYAFSGGRITKTTNGNLAYLTSESTVVTGEFYITDFTGSPEGKATPRITIVAGVKDARGNPLTNIQTTVSARLIYYKTP